MGLCVCPVGWLAWGIPALEPTGGWVGPGLGEKIVNFRRAHAKDYSPELSPPMSLSLRWDTAAPCLRRRPSDTSRWFWSRLFMRSVLFPMGPSAYNVLWKFQEYNFCFLCNSCNQTPLVFKTMWSGGSSSWCQTLKLESLTWCSELPLLWENLSDIIIFAFVGHPSSGYGIWFQHSCTTPIFSWLLLWM